jgi:cysteine desulfurase/selenocysteine lyase
MSPWTNTMSTSNPASESPFRDFVPDAGVIARLANEFFVALPGQAAGPTPSASSVISGQPPAPALTPDFSPSIAAPVTGAPTGSLASLPVANHVLGPEVLSALPGGLSLSTHDFQGSRGSEKNTDNPFTDPSLPTNLDARAFSFKPVIPPAGEKTPNPGLNPSVPLTAETPVDVPTGAGTGGVPGEFSAVKPGERTKSNENPLGTFDAFSFIQVPLGGESNDHPSFDAAWYKRDFPILQERVNGRPLVWLDNAATTQKPQAVIDRLSYFYAHENSNVHRAAHTLAARATDAYEGAREKVRRFLGASSAREIVFVRGATEAINLVAKAWGAQNIGEGDEIVVSWLEHHANIVPWQQLVNEKGAKLKVIPVDDRGEVLLNEYEKLLNSRTKLVSVTQVSNALGTVVPVKEIVEIAHRRGIKVLVDGAQAVSHMRVNVAELGTDFYVFSGHKVFAPTGIGVLYGKEELLNSFQPWQGGGNMITDVTFEKSQYQLAPLRFEAGTGNIADAVGLGAAVDYLDRVGLENVSRHEHDLLEYATRLLKRVPGLRIIGNAAEKAGVLSFIIDGFRNEDIGKALDREGIAVRSGHHCAQPILRRLGLEGTIRASLAFYNTFEDLEALENALCRIVGTRVPSAR